MQTNKSNNTLTSLADLAPLVQDFSNPIVELSDLTTDFDLGPLNNQIFHFELDINLKSLKLETHKFSNHLESIGNTYHQLLVNLLSTLKSPRILDECVFILEEPLDYSNSLNGDRCKSIVETTHPYETSLFKSKFRDSFSKPIVGNTYHPVRLFWRKKILYSKINGAVEKNILILQVVDLYHLLATNMHNQVARGEITYEDVKDYDVCLSSIE